MYCKVKPSGFSSFLHIQTHMYSHIFVRISLIVITHKWPFFICVCVRACAVSVCSCFQGKKDAEPSRKMREKMFFFSLGFSVSPLSSCDCIFFLFCCFAFLSSCSFEVCLFRIFLQDWKVNFKNGHAVEKLPRKSWFNGDSFFLASTNNNREIWWKANRK